MTIEWRSYQSDDRDVTDSKVLVIGRDEQGDLYVAVRGIGDRTGPAVRLCASGGASSAEPAFFKGMQDAFGGIGQCRVCGGRGKIETRCRDPQCGDSTWDHDCNDGVESCRACSGTGRRPG